MKTAHLDQAYQLYLKANPNLSPERIGVVLLLDSIYEHIPEDIERFRTLYRHLDPAIIDQPHEGITFLKIAASSAPDEVLRQRLNDYINIKFSVVGHYRTYDDNMVRFAQRVRAVTTSIDEILDQAALPADVVAVLREREPVRSCEDFFELLQLYRATRSRRTRFEILRKIGLIVLVSRISRHYIEADLRAGIEQVSRAFVEGLGFERTANDTTYYFWMDCGGALNYTRDRREAEAEHAADGRRRARLPLPAYPLQAFHCTPYRTRDGTEILDFQIRNKLERDGAQALTSALEKIARTNLQYPKDLLDVIGVRLLVRDEEGIPALVSSLERFLGGSSTRKERKNTLHKFGRSKVSEFSSSEYSVWKAIYDIALPHPSIAHIRRVMALTHDNEPARAELQKRLEFFLDTPKDSVVEVQLQDLPSFLLGIAHGSPAEHSLLKARQIRMNSFYKFFPEEIYGTDLESLKDVILHGGSELLSLPG